jgi:hypothetical protein
MLGVPTAFDSAARLDNFHKTLAGSESCLRRWPFASHWPRRFGLQECPPLVRELLDPGLTFRMAWLRRIGSVLTNGTIMWIVPSSPANRRHCLMLLLQANSHNTMRCFPRASVRQSITMPKRFITKTGKLLECTIKVTLRR